MIISIQPGQPIRLPLDTAFTLDLSALLSEGNTIYGFYLNLLEGTTGMNNMLDTLLSDDDRSITVVPRDGWTGVVAADSEPLRIAGDMVFYSNSSENLVVPLASTIDPRTELPAARGTAGRDAILFDAEDADLTTVHLVDTSGGSDRAAITNGAGVMLGRSGDDTLLGWNGDDALYGGAGNDAFTADREGHQLYGGSGMDTLTVTLSTSLSGGTTILDGGIGNDIIRAQGNSLATGGEGTDRFVLDLSVPVLNSMMVTDFVRGEDLLGVQYSNGDTTLTTQDFAFVEGGGGAQDLVGAGQASMA